MVCKVEAGGVCKPKDSAADTFVPQNWMPLLVGPKCFFRYDARVQKRSKYAFVSEWSNCCFEVHGYYHPRAADSDSTCDALFAV